VTRLRTGNHRAQRAEAKRARRVPLKGEFLDEQTLILATWEFVADKGTETMQ
jgi:hypothetical protein